MRHGASGQECPAAAAGAGTPCSVLQFLPPSPPRANPVLEALDSAASACRSSAGWGTPEPLSGVGAPGPGASPGIAPHAAPSACAALCSAPCGQLVAGTSTLQFVGANAMQGAAARQRGRACGQQCRASYFRRGSGRVPRQQQPHLGRRRTGHNAAAARGPPQPLRVTRPRQAPSHLPRLYSCGCWRVVQPAMPSPAPHSASWWTQQPPAPPAFCSAHWMSLDWGQPASRAQAASAYHPPCPPPHPGAPALERRQCAWQRQHAAQHTTRSSSSSRRRSAGKGSRRPTRRHGQRAVHPSRWWRGLPTTGQAAGLRRRVRVCLLRPLQLRATLAARRQQLQPPGAPAARAARWRHAGSRRPPLQQHRPHLQLGTSLLHRPLLHQLRSRRGNKQRRQRRPNPRRRPPASPRPAARQSRPRRAAGPRPRPCQRRSSRMRGIAPALQRLYSRPAASPRCTGLHGGPPCCPGSACLRPSRCWTARGPCFSLQRAASTAACQHQGRQLWLQQGEF